MSVERMHERFESFENALARLKEALIKDISDDILVDATIQRFEFTLELSWKLMKDYLEYQRIDEVIRGPRDCIRLAFKYELILDGDSWLDMLEDRNIASHTYNQDKALEIYKAIKERYINLLKDLCKKMEDLI